MTRTDRPNLLVILSDQLRRDALGLYGDPNIETPNIDRLSREGTHFTAACSTYPLCIPFRFTLMTGQYAHTRMIPALGWRMSPAERTLADELNEAGYETAYIGKWHLYGGQIHMPGYSGKEEGTKPIPRCHQGRWQYWRGFDVRNDFYDTYYFADDDPTPRKIEKYQTDGLFDLGLQYLRQRDTNRPFCCVVSVEPPHPPFVAPPEYEQKWLTRDVKPPQNFLAPQPTEAQPPRKDRQEMDRDYAIDQLKRYYAMIDNLDANVGRMLDYLQRESLLDSTVIVFLSDHGEFAGSHSLRSKQYPHEESIGIPLIVRGPGVATDRRIEEPVCTEDLFPTLLGLIGLSPHDPPPGADLTPLIAGQTDAIDREGVMLQFVSEPRSTQPFHEQTWRGFRSQRYKYTVLGDLRGSRAWQFFDLQEDPHELNNLIDDPDCAELIECHHRLLRDRMNEVRDDFPLAEHFTPRQSAS